jgi:hypothetical protein
MSRFDLINRIKRFDSVVLVDLTWQVVSGEKTNDVDFAMHFN